MNALGREALTVTWLRTEGSVGIIQLDDGHEWRVPRAALPPHRTPPVALRICVQTPQELTAQTQQLTKQLLEEMLNGDDQRSHA